MTFMCLSLCTGQSLLEWSKENYGRGIGDSQCILLFQDFILLGVMEKWSGSKRGYGVKRVFGLVWIVLGWRKLQPVWILMRMTHLKGKKQYREERAVARVLLSRQEGIKSSVSVECIWLFNSFGHVFNIFGPSFIWKIYFPPPPPVKRQCDSCSLLVLSNVMG